MNLASVLSAKLETKVEQPLQITEKRGFSPQILYTDKLSLNTQVKEWHLTNAFHSKNPIWRKYS